MNDDIARYLNEIPHDREFVVRDPKTGALSKISYPQPALGKFFETSGRHIVQVKYNGEPLSFYLSTGQSPKEGVKPGQWYPVFGQTADGWLMKGSSKDIAEYYGNKGWADVAKWLDARIGDVRDSSDSKNPETVARRDNFVERSGLRRIRTNSLDEAFRGGLSRGYGIQMEQKPETGEAIKSFLREIADRASGNWKPTSSGGGGGGPMIPVRGQMGGPAGMQMLKDYRAGSPGPNRIKILE